MECFIASSRRNANGDWRVATGLKQPNAALRDALATLSEDRFGVRRNGSTPAAIFRR